jgi:hypothetical protein
VKELEPYLVAHSRELRESIEGGWYKPQPVRRVEIPKPDTGGDNPAADWLVRVLQYRGPEGASGTDKRLVTAADKADALETLEEGTDAM